MLVKIKTNSGQYDIISPEPKVRVIYDKSYCPELGSQYYYY